MGNLNVLEQIFKDHTVQNPVDDISYDKLPSNAMFVHNQQIRHLFVTIQVLDEKNKNVIETITGVAESGSVKVDGKSLIRRAASLTMLVNDYTFPSQNSLIWFNRYIKLYVGIKDNSQHEHIVNFLVGTFWINKGSYSIDENNSRITLEIQDKMMKWHDSQLELPLKINVNTPINVAIRTFMEHIGETDFGEIADTRGEEVVPYTLEFNAGDDITKVISTLRDMYMDYTCGYNIRGEFEFTKVESQTEQDLSTPKWRFDADDLTLKTMIGFKEDYSLNDIKNRIVVYGSTSEVTGLMPVGEARITDVKSPFNIYSIGERTKIITESKYATNEQCISKAKYEVWKASNFKESCDIESVPIYLLDVNDVIEVRHPVTKVVSKYMIDGFNFGLDVAAKMSINAHKIYYVTLEYGKEKSPLVDAIVRGINNHGWLSLGEERIRDCYNMMGSGEATITVRFQDVISGGEQASVTSYPSTKNQTLMIDLADFSELDLKNENGSASNRSTGDYADRVLGHEMFHATLNDYLGHDTAVQVPTYINEGFAEFIHGAKERFLSCYTDKNKNDKKQALITLCEQLVNGKSFDGTSEEYVASYIAAVAIYKLCNKNQWTNLFINLKKQKNISINFLYKFLPIAQSENEVKQLLLNKIRNMDDVWEFLFNENDKDTGSVGGIHFMNLYGVPLNAESVFNNANATDVSIGFKIQIVR